MSTPANPSSDLTANPSSARAEILRRVRDALGGPHPPVEVPREYAGAGTNPAAAAAEAVVDLFVERVEDYRAVVLRARPDTLAATIAEALGETMGPTTGKAGRVVVPDGVDPGWLADLDPARVVRDTGLSAAELDRVDAVLTGATVGIAATGTIVLDHGPDQGRRALTLLPDVHVCVVRTSELVPDVPDAIDRLAATQVERRPLTWISGPSATSDIELERVEGVHGPRRLRVVLLAN